jgi:trimethylamine:corrinoid methyltransferase-like protein
VRLELRFSTRTMEFNEETLALDVVHKHALSADFLGTEHTRAPCS